MILISGNGRGAGKTTFACDLIRKFFNQIKITGIKISPHFHKPNEYAELIYADDDLILTRERNVSEGKDSSRMLQAGADKVFFVQTRDKIHPGALMKLSTLWDSGEPVICESGGLINHVSPGLFFVLYKSGISGKEPVGNHLNRADKLIDLTNQDFDFDISSIGFTNSNWHLIVNK